MTFEEYEATVKSLPVSLRNNRDRIDLPVNGLQAEAGKIGRLLGDASVTGRLQLTPEESKNLQEKFSDVLWYLTTLCHESGMTLEKIAAQSIAQLQARMREFDPDKR
jgi:NTP pyrophosphatase (non-canonical NTP hydrolase)